MLKVSTGFSLVSVGVALAIAVTGCTHHVDESSTSNAAEELRARAPSPFVTQFVGSYSNLGNGELANVELLRNGRYRATYADSHVERGVYAGASTSSNGVPTLPLTISLRTNGHSWTLSISSYPLSTTPVAASIDGEQDALTPDDTVGPNESLCDGSGGTWSDDEVDANGLFCKCPARTAYVPSQGGCVR